ncbi:MAG: Rieske (2Fe-2S) protein [Actinobacteria bacterium]|nr:MAG: Rieske (2Fe-2S) protein [Actinomycetota bacterium]
MSDSTSANSPETAANPGTELAAQTIEAPGLPPHTPRQTDIDPRAAKRVERQVGIMFILSAVFAVLFVVFYLTLPVDKNVNVPFSTATINASNVALGLTFGLSIFLIGAGAIHWAKKLMPDQEVVQERHLHASSPEERAEAGEVFWQGADESGFGQRKIIRRSLILAMALFPIPMIVMLRDLGPKNLDETFQAMRHTLWEKGMPIVLDPTGRKVRPADIPLGGIVSAMPEDLDEVQELEGNLNARAKAAIILVRMTPEEIQSQQGDGWDYEGILAFSKICTHVGCPIALYQQRTHHLLCPCHQSTFDLSDSGNVVFGPAARSLPQLPIELDEEGFLVASSDFAQPVGPSYWERDR